MRYKFLLINPWIYDFSAYNLWAKPLGLIKVAEFLSSYDIEIFFIDCTDSYKIKKYGAGKYREEIVEKPAALKEIKRYYRRYGLSVEQFKERLTLYSKLDAVLITSMMSYWYPGIQKVTEIIREYYKNVPVILGGIYATLYNHHAKLNSGADLLYEGSLNNNLLEDLDNLGFKLIKKRGPIPYYNLNLYERWTFAPLLTTEGCPFSCRYCASNLLSGGYKRKSAGQIINDIIELYNSGIRDFAFYDDALLIDPENHIKPILNALIKYNYHNINIHTPNGLHAKFIDEDLAFLMKKTNFKTIRLSLETVDTNRQIESGNKVNNEDLKRSVFYLKKAGFTKEDIGVYLMYGLLNQPLKEVKEGIEFLKNLKVRINLTEYSPIRGTTSWNEFVKKGIFDDNLDPLLTNNSVFSFLYSNYDMNELNEIKLDVKNYNSAM